MPQRQIKQKIEQIISARKLTRLPKVEEEVMFLQDILSKIDNLDSVIATIKSQMNQKSGPYYSVLLADPTMEARFNIVSTGQVRTKLQMQLNKLEILRKRFSREAVQIAFVGRERQGKSCFLQSISGLNNSVIPAYSGTSCTGTVSVIHNTGTSFSATISFYSLPEFLSIMQDKLKKFFPGKVFQLNSVQDLKGLDLSDYQNGTNIALNSEFNKFIDGYVNHADSFSALIGSPDLVTSDEKQIIQHVAQYEEFDAIPEGEAPSLYSKKIKTDNDGNSITIWVKNYYKCLAVKSANIYTPFPSIDDAKIVLVDTIGMGDSTDAARIEDEMFRVLREDCDAAVNVFKPDSNGGGFNDEQTRILTKISNELKERDPMRWILYVINKVETKKGNNIENIPAIMKAAKESFSKDNPPVADVLDIDAADPIDVNDRLLSPLLDIVTENLDDIDSKLVAETNKTGEILYQEYKLLSDSVSKVISGSMQQGSNELRKFRQLFQTDLDYTNELKKLDDKYAESKEKVCPPVKNSIEIVISSLTKQISKPDQILIDVETGIDATNAIFEKHVKNFRNKIYEAFRGINTNVLIPLQNEVKDSIIDILYKNTKFGKISLQGYAIEDGPSQKWLSCFIDEKIDKDTYPKMYEMLNFVIDYQLNIQGLIEYNVARCLNTIDKHNEEFRTMNPITGVTDEVHAKKIWSEIVNRTTLIQNKMRAWRDDFSLIPSHSFYARISMFRDMMVDDEATYEELYNFYSENRMAIWRDEFVGMIQETEAFGAWNTECKAIADLCLKNSFVIKLKDLN